jgi:hypothetical protein
MAGDGGKFVCARSSAGESRQSRLAQPMKHAVLWKPGGVIPASRALLIARNASSFLKEAGPLRPMLASI